MGTNAPNILLLDIETFPDVSFNWTAYESNAIEIREHWFILSFSAKWLKGEHITKGFWEYKGSRGDGPDEGLVRHLWKLLDRADVVVAHNARFDVRKSSARFIVHGLPPPAPYQVIDTLKEVRRIADFSSNKLDWLCSQLHLGRKVEHQGFPLWKGCVSGDKAARKKMLRYNRHDVVLLEKLYLLLRPWIKSNAGMWSEGTTCNACGSRELKSEGWRRTATALYRRVVCTKCGHWMRIPKSEPRDKPLVSL